MALSSDTRKEYQETKSEMEKIISILGSSSDFDDQCEVRTARRQLARVNELLDQ